MSERPFVLRVRIGRYEIDIRGTREEVLKTLDELPDIVDKVSKAFRGAFVPTSADGSRVTPPTESAYPRISSRSSCDAILELMSSDWGKRPKTLSDIARALEANALFFPTATIGKSLLRLVRRGKLRRWKTENGYSYILA